MNTVNDLQTQLQLALENLRTFQDRLPAPLQPLVCLAPPPGSRAIVSLRHAKSNRQVKRTAPADRWSPRTGYLEIRYEPVASEERPAAQPAAARELTATIGQRDLPAHETSARMNEAPMNDLLRALGKAEQDPQLTFVSLKWFRDTYLPQLGYP